MNEELEQIIQDIADRILAVELAYDDTEAPYGYAFERIEHALYDKIIDKHVFDKLNAFLNVALSDAKNTIHMENFRMECLGTYTMQARPDHVFKVFSITCLSALTRRDTYTVFIDNLDRTHQRFIVYNHKDGKGIPMYPISLAPNEDAHNCKFVMEWDPFTGPVFTSARKKKAIHFIRWVFDAYYAFTEENKKGK